MSWWIFDTLAAAQVAEAAATATLPDDTLVTGEVAPVQVTRCWADIVALTDGRFAFPAKAGMALPAGATEMEDIAGLLPETGEA
ncbi:hypothetical protein CLG96_02185 [Sphingomonas oleivorans]|uniref:Uncharacterized protein n=1 Tax=Sphingomonas oleivorans TaxID=1735121 RepID=A0A2T5G1F0_9SPHN|nr:hypothetical protein [Sphingomonas oleivorans]PTQ12974.1 hypothetical protein CLG96_02185 [Sphingomonas oleivorans]